MNPTNTMEAYDLRSDVNTKGQQYYVQTNLIPSQKTIIVSLFHEGKLLSKRIEKFDSALAKDDARDLVRRLHEEKLARIDSLLRVKEKLIRMDDAKAHIKLGEALYQQSLYREAMAEVVRAVKMGADDSKAFLILGSSLGALGDHQKAVKAFEKGIELSPQYPDLHNNLGKAYLQLRRCGDAVRAFERATELNKYYYDAFLNLAVALCLNVVEKDEFELARGLKDRLTTILGKTLQLKPSLDTEEFRQARQGVENERYDIALNKLTQIQEELATLSKDDLSLDLYLILKFGENVTEEEIDRHIDRATRALDANPNFADLQNDLGVLYTAKCKLYIDKAKDAFGAALKVNRNFKKAGKNLKLTENDGQGIDLLLRALLD